MLSFAAALLVLAKFPDQHEQAQRLRIRSHSQLGVTQRTRTFDDPPIVQSAM
jgi:hypothetical protein